MGMGHGAVGGKRTRIVTAARFLPFVQNTTARAGRAVALAIAPGVNAAFEQACA
ncbi:MAG: hypothetical protein KatS3mg082_2785 [Nitrospiraceae bacterium]|nr:MAG: hypothetical protein KatS3mg082_2785 [Nitrospiraceae bacterium]